MINLRQTIINNSWTELAARFMTAAGVDEHDIVHIAFGYGLFTGAFGLHYGAERIGASVIPMSSGNTDKQIMIMQDYKSTALVCTPSYALTLVDRMEKTVFTSTRLVRYRERFEPCAADARAMLLIGAAVEGLPSLRAIGQEVRAREGIREDLRSTLHIWQRTPGQARVVQGVDRSLAHETGDGYVVALGGVLGLADADHGS